MVRHGRTTFSLAQYKSYGAAQFSRTSYILLISLAGHFSARCDAPELHDDSAIDIIFMHLFLDIISQSIEDIYFTFKYVYSKFFGPFIYFIFPSKIIIFNEIIDI